MTEEELEDFFYGHGWKPYFVTATDTQKAHEEMAKTLDKIVKEINSLKGRATTDHEWPMLVLTTPKGWTGPKEIEEKQMEEWKGFEKSLEFWHKLHLISSVERKEDDDKQIVLVVDDDYVQQKLDESQTETSIARQLVEIYSKINKELKEAVEISFTGKKLVNYVPIREIVITTEIESLNKEIDKSLNVRSLEPVSLEDKEDKKKLIL